MANVRVCDSAEVMSFLQSRSVGEMLQLMQSIREPASQAALTATLLLVPPKAPVKRTTTPNRPKKALNAFVGFRCYYTFIPVFKPYPMKAISGIIGAMWQCDPNRSLWSLIAKAWSMIRDQIGKEQAPLDEFLNIICPYLQIPSPEVYLELGGWVFSVDEDDKPIVERNYVPALASLAAGNTDLALSVFDIIAYCQSMGYAQGFACDEATASRTFLGQSLPSANGMYDNNMGMTAPDDRVQVLRMAARNKRRNKRESEKGAKFVANLRAEIARAHEQIDSGVLFNRPQATLDDTFNAEPQMSLADTSNAESQLGAASNLGDPLEITNATTAIPDTLELPVELADLLGAPSETFAGHPFDAFEAAGMETSTLQEFDFNCTDWNPFRTGADENITLPPFDNYTA